MDAELLQECSYTLVSQTPILGKTGRLVTAWRNPAMH